MKSLTCFFLVAALLAIAECKPNRRRGGGGGCQRISSDSVCNDMGYGETLFPNNIGHQTIEEAEDAVQTLLTGVASITGTGNECYMFLRSFMCQLHVPKCISQASVALPPCREMCMMMQEKCGDVMRTVPQLSSIDCAILPYSGNMSVPNCTPVTNDFEENICCPRPFKNVGGACVKILKKARPYKSSLKSCESEDATFAKFAPSDALLEFLKEELFDSVDSVWIGVELQEGSGMGLVWNFDGTAVGPEYLRSAGLAPLAEVNNRNKRVCFTLNSNGDLTVVDCRNTEAPSLCQMSNDCPYGISDIPHEEAQSTDIHEQTEEVEKGSTPLPESGDCEPQDLLLCHGLDYSETRFPNSLGHMDKDESFDELKKWAPLIGIDCSPHMKELLCALYAPPCISTSAPAQYPCREVCEAAKDGCLSQMQQFGHDWPSIINCTKFPAYGDENSCYVGSVAPPLADASSPSCEPLQDPLCSNAGYTETRMPNQFGHNDQNEASMTMNEFQSLLFLDCSDFLEPFLCSMVYPPCVSGMSIPPCRELCEVSKRGCESFFQYVGQEWPEEFECSLLPWSNSTDTSCLSIESTVNPHGEPEPESWPDTRKCESITVPLCQEGLSYYTTSLPNALGHERQEDAGLEVHQFYPLVKIECSIHLREFLCSAYVPECNSSNTGFVLPCSELCQAAKDGCIEIMEEFGFDWPYILECELLPSASDFSTSCFMGSLLSDSEQTEGQCEPLRVPMCMNMPYNNTYIAALTQEEIEGQLNSYLPLIEFGCSAALPYFVCALHAPPCTVLGNPLMPCSEMCEAVFAPCAAVFEQFGVTELFQCSILPTKESGTCFFMDVGGLPDPEVMPSDQCEPLEVTMCHGMGYTHTSFPNYLFQQTQTEAEAFSSVFSAIPSSAGRCAEELIGYTCQLLAPRCVGEPMRKVPPCKARCERTEKVCQEELHGVDISTLIDCNAMEIYGSYCEDEELIEVPVPVVNVTTHNATQVPSSCQSVEISMCADLGFTLTASTDDSVVESEVDMASIMPLVQTMCSPLLLPLICSVHAPQCNPVTGETKPPCREICRDILKQCKKTIKALGIEAPSFLSCKRYPSAEDGNCAMDIAPPEKPTIVEYTRTDDALTVHVEQPEGTYGIPGRGFLGYTVIHDQGAYVHASDGDPTYFTFGLSPEQSLRHIVVTVVPFNDFGEGRASDFLTKTATSMPRPSNLQLSPRPANDGTLVVRDMVGETLVCSNAEDDVMAYPEWSRDGMVIEVEGVEYDGYRTKRYGDRTTVLQLENIDSATYSCSLAGQDDTRDVHIKLPCEQILQPFCGYTSVQLPNFYGHLSQGQALAGAMPFMPLMQAQCSQHLGVFVCSSFVPACNTSAPPPCRELCQSSMMDCSDVAMATDFDWPEYAACDRFPSMADGNCIPGTIPEPEPEMTPEPEPEMTPEPEPEMTPEPEPEMKPDTGASMPNATDSSSAAQPPFTLKKRRYDIVNQGVKNKFQGWADVQGQGAANDYCRVLKLKKKRFYLACALAGSDDELGYSSLNIQSGDFDEGFKDTWYMRDEDGDGRDDFCRCVAGEDTTYVSCMRAVEDGFQGHHDFTPTTTPSDCQRIRVNPFLGHSQPSN